MRVAPRAARLGPRPICGFRGYSVTEQADRARRSARATSLESTAPRWRDLEGYYTRFGDVRRLLRGVDDRYVIMNAGDELRLRFKEAPPPAPGWCAISSLSATAG